MQAQHTSDGSPGSGKVFAGVDVATSAPFDSLPPTPDPSLGRPPAPDTASPLPPRLQEPSLSAAPPAVTPARLPRTSSLLPLPHTVVAAATTTPATLTPAYSPSETPSFNADLLPRSDNLPDTPPNEPYYETDLASQAASSRVELSPPLLPPVVSLDSLGDGFGNHRPSSLEVLPGGEASDFEDLGTSSSQDTSDSSGTPLPSMPYEKARDSYALSNDDSRGRVGKGGADLANKGRGMKLPSQKVMLSRALQKANTAVQLDNAQNFEGARRSYVEACDLLRQVLLKTTVDEDKRKLESIRRTYDARIEELDRIVPWQAMNNKELPAPPGNTHEFDGEFLHASILEVETEITALNFAKDETTLPRQRMRRDSRNLSDGSLDPSRPARPKDEQPVLHSTFHRASHRSGPSEEYTYGGNRVPQPLTCSRRPSSPNGQQQHERCDSAESGTVTESYHSGSWSDSRDGTGHFRDGSQNSWLDPIHELADYSSTSVNSQDSPGRRSEHFFKPSSSSTEAEFDTALDAAVEAAYNEGLVPVNSLDYDIIDRTEAIVMKALQKVEEARERVRQTEREAYPEDTQRPTAHQHDELHCVEFYDDHLSSDEEERILEGITRDYNIADFTIKQDQRPSIVQHQGPRTSEAQAEARMSDEAHTLGARSRAVSVEKPAHKNEQCPLPLGWQPSVPPPKHSLPELPLSRAASPGQSVRSRRLSGQNPKQLKIQTTQLRQPPATSHGEPTQTETITEPTSAIETAAVRERPHTSRSTRKTTPPAMEVSEQEPEPEPEPEPQTESKPETKPEREPEPEREAAAVITSPSKGRAHGEVDDGHAGHHSSPTMNRLRKNFSSSSLRSLKSRNLSLPNIHDGHDMSPGTPSSLHPGSARTPAMPSLPTPLAAALREQMDVASPGSFHLFEDSIHLPASPGSPNPLAADPPAALEPCPTDVTLRPFWLMRCLYQTLVHPRGGYLSTKLFVPRDVWRVKAVKLKNVEDKISNCDLLTAALLKLAKVDTCDADAILEEMQTLEGILEQVQNTLTRKLGNDVGVQGSGVLFKEASNVVEGDGAPVVPRTSSVSGKSSSFSWRRLRPKNSSMGLGGTYSSRLVGSEGSKETATLPTLPMTPQPTSRPPKSDINQAHFLGPNASYMNALARLFDAAQSIDLIARQVDDPGLRHADKTQVGLELCTRHAAEFFGFYVCRFVLADLSLLLDKFIKRGSEWVLA